MFVRRRLHSSRHPFLCRLRIRNPLPLLVIPHVLEPQQRWRVGTTTSWKRTIEWNKALFPTPRRRHSRWWANRPSPPPPLPRVDAAVRSVLLGRPPPPHRNERPCRRRWNWNPNRLRVRTALLITTRHEWPNRNNNNHNYRSRRHGGSFCRTVSVDRH